MSLATHIRGYFWDIDPQTANPKKHPRYYMTRILEQGNERAVNWLFEIFGTSKVKTMLPILRLSERSKNYWQHYYKLE